MVIDTSAVLAVLFDEPEADAFGALFERERVKRMSVANFAEAQIRLIRLPTPMPRRLMERLLESAEIALEPVSETQAHLAIEAYRDYGRGRHPAGLNFGDCFAYALAKDKGEPLLFKGDDFARTDVEPALRPLLPG